MALPDILDPSTDFGLPKSNYKPIADPTKEVDFAEYERLAIAVAGLSYSCPKAWVKISAAAATAGAMLIDHSAMWGDSSSVKPTIARASTGSFTITWSAAYADLNPTISRQVTASVSLNGGVLTPMARAGDWYVTCAANVATVNIYDISGDVSNINFFLAVY